MPLDRALANAQAARHLDVSQALQLHQQKHRTHHWFESIEQCVQLLQGFAHGALFFGRQRKQLGELREHFKVGAFQ